MKASFKSRRENPLIHRNPPIVAILVLLIFSNLTALVGDTAGDPALQDNLDGTATASWSFQNPADYSSQNVSVLPSNVTLSQQGNQFLDTTFGDFQQGSLLLNVDIASDPGNVTLLDTSSAGVWDSVWVSIDDINGKDAYIDGGFRNRNYGVSTPINVEPVDQKRILIGFNISSFQDFDLVTSAEILLKVDDTDLPMPLNVSAHQVNASWIEGTGDGTTSGDGVTYRSRDGTTTWQQEGGDFNPIPESTVVVTDQGAGGYRWDITQLLGDWINGTRPNFGVILVPEDVGAPLNEKRFHSKETIGGGNRPRLEIEHISKEGGVANGTYISRAIDAQTPVNWGNISWNSTIPSQTSMSIQTRTGDCLGNWTNWSTAYAVPAGSQISSPPGRCLQYRVFMETFNRTKTPVLEEVRVDYPAYASEGSVETQDLAPSNWISWESFDASVNLMSETNISFWYSTNSGVIWREIFAGENLQGIGLPAIRFRANLTTANGTRSPVLVNMSVTYQFYGNLDHIHMSMAAWNGTTDQTIDLDSIGHDSFHHVTPFTRKWETDDPWGSVDSSGLYSPGKVGTWKVYCNNSADSISNYTLVNILPGTTARIEIDPWDPGLVTTDDNLTFNVTGYDSKGNLVGPVMANWSVAGGIGTIQTGPSSSALFDPTTPGAGIVGANDGFGHTNTTNTIQVVAGSRAAVGIEPWSPGTLTTDEKLNFTAYALDADGNQIGTSTVFWSVNSSIGIIPPGPSETSTFEATTIGFGAISIDDGLGHTNTTDTIEVIEGILDSIVVQPDDISIHGGDYMNFTATGYDADGHIVPLINPVWQTNAGTITNSSSSGATLKASDIEVLNGWIRVTAIFQSNVTGISNFEVVLVNVKPVILGTIPNQFKQEDYGSWSIDLSSHASDLQDPLSELTWSFSDHDTSLTTIYGDNVKGNHIITFSTNPNAYGEDVVTAWLRDSDGYVDSTVFTINISAVNDMPIIESISPFTIHYDVPYSYYFYDYVSDVETQKEDLVLSSSEPDNISFDGLWGTFLYPEDLNGVTVYPIITVHDEDGGEMPTMLAIAISDDYVPVLVKDLPDVVLDEGEEIKGYFDLDDYFDDPDEDSLFFSSGNIHTEITINSDHTVDFKAPEDWSGNETVSFRAMDPENARAEDMILVTVLPINDPPTISGVPDLVVHYDDPARPFWNYTFDLAPYVEDVDNDISELNITTDDPIHIFFNNSLNTIMEIHYPESMKGQVIAVRITVSDGSAEAFQDMNITVSDDWPPEATSAIPDRSFFEDSSFPNAYNVADFFLDIEGDDLAFASVSTNIIVDIDPSTSVVSFSSTQDWYGFEYVTFRATDTHGGIAEQTAKVTVIPVNDAPEILEMPDITVHKGSLYTLDLRDYISDKDNDFSDLVIIVSGQHFKSTVTLAGSILILNYPDEGTDQIRIDVNDGTMTAFAMFDVTIVGPPPPSIWDLIYWPWSLVVAVLLCAVVLALNRSFFAKIQIDEVFLIYGNGSLIHHSVVGRQTDVDEDIFSNMLTAIQAFIADSFKKVEDSPVKMIEFGERKIAIERGKKVFLAVVFTGHETKHNLRPLKDAIDEIEKEYHMELESWDGFLAPFQSVDAVLQKNLGNLEGSE